MRHKVCPICGTTAHPQATKCLECGASLQGVAAVESYEDAGPKVAAPYDFHYGETDLIESGLKWKGATYVLGSVLALAVLACVGLGFIGVARFAALFDVPGSNAAPLTATSAATLANASDFATNTPQPTRMLATVTADAPPTRTPTPSPAPTETPGPCMQEVRAGDSLIGIVSRCGHRDMDVIDTVLEMNGLSAPEVIQVGQTLEIPWPTATVDPEAQPTETSENAEEAGTNPLVAFLPDDEDEIVIAALPTATLQPGVTWHQVVSGETIIHVASQYGANVKILSELNPEVMFSQCDFGQFGGGPSCLVNLYEGQRLRVPAPTPTPTLSPTPSGSETATPSPTPTYNAPSALSPGDRALFQREELITLRWVASGTLAEGQVYRVTVKDVTANKTHAGDTTELFFIVPEAWQGQDNRRHEYEWTVSVIDSRNPDNPHFSTRPRTFVWEGLVEEEQG